MSDVAANVTYRFDLASRTTIQLFRNFIEASVATPAFAATRNYQIILVSFLISFIRKALLEIHSTCLPRAFL